MAALPEHLQLGVPGMRELLSQLPSDAVEQVNANILREPRAAGPLDCFHLCVKEGKLKFPENDEEANGYVNQFHVTRWEKKDGSVRRAMVRRAMLNHAPLGTAPSPPITHDRRVASHSSRARVSSLLRRSRW